jgi:glycine betaine/proline transport system permease protein
MTAVTAPAIRRGEASIPKWAWFLAIMAVAAVLYVLFAGTAVQPHDNQHPLFLALNGVRDWIRDNRDNPVYFILFVVPRSVVDVLLESLTGALHAIGWPALIAVAGLLGYVADGLRRAVLTALGFAALGFLGLWTSSVDTLGAIIAAVSLSILFGVPLGILVAQNARARRILTPILDVMQIMPTFAYLGPFVLLYGIGPAAAAIVTLIYAMPAAIRITALGIRGVPVNTVEAGRSLGATGRQLLTSVKLPMARKELALALNQVLMLSLSMIVITALINAPGLGQDTLTALIRNDAGAMFDAGVAIVILAIALDRLTEGFSFRLDPHRRATTGITSADRRWLRVGLVACAGLALIGLVIPFAQDFPDAITISFREPVNAFVDWLRTDVAWLTSGLKDIITYGLLNPIQEVLTQAPFWLVIGVVVALTVLISGMRAAMVAGFALVAIFAMGLWQHSMETLMQVLVATGITFAIGLALGIASARSDRVAGILRPILDTAQTIPAFVYLLPALILFEATRMTAIFAAVIFALPPVIRLVDIGIRSVPPTIIESATSSGADSRQMLTAVQLPIARPAIILAANQAVIIVLSMIVVGGLVGGGALGYDVVAGFSQGSKFGLGLAAGFALVLLGVMLDRMTQGAAGRSASPRKSSGWLQRA